MSACFYVRFWKKTLNTPEEVMQMIVLNMGQINHAHEKIFSFSYHLVWLDATLDALANEAFTPNPIVSSKQYDLGQNIWRLFHFSAQFFFTTSETELGYYHQKVNVRVASRVAERLKTYDLRKLGNFKKIPEMLEFDGELPVVHPKAKFDVFWQKNCKNSAVKHSIEKPVLLNFVNLSPTFCPRLQLNGFKVQTVLLDHVAKYSMWTSSDGNSDGWDDDDVEEPDDGGSADEQ